MGGAGAPVRAVALLMRRDLFAGRDHPLGAGVFDELVVAAAI